MISLNPFVNKAFPLFNKSTNWAALGAIGATAAVTTYLLANNMTSQLPHFDPKLINYAVGTAVPFGSVETLQPLNVGAIQVDRVIQPLETLISLKGELFNLVNNNTALSDSLGALINLRNQLLVKNNRTTLNSMLSIALDCSLDNCQEKILFKQIETIGKLNELMPVQQSRHIQKETPDICSRGTYRNLTSRSRLSSKY